MHNSIKKARLFKHLNIYLVLHVIIAIQLAYKTFAEKIVITSEQRNVQRSLMQNISNTSNLPAKIERSFNFARQ